MVLEEESEVQGRAALSRGRAGILVPVSVTPKPGLSDVEEGVSYHLSFFPFFLGCVIIKNFTLLADSFGIHFISRIF